MQIVEFQGASRLIPLLDEAVRRADPFKTTHAIKDLLCQLFRAHDVELPAGICKPCTESYARRLLYRSEELGYTVVAMTWGLLKRELRTYCAWKGLAPAHFGL